MAEVLFISKALAPPWNDSGKNLVYDLARGLERHRATVMVARGVRGGPLELPRARRAQVYARQVGYAPSLLDQARVFGYLLGARGHHLWHFFFAPNPRSCRAGRLTSRVRRVPTVHTISSAPRDVPALVPLLFADRHVVLSRHTEQRLLAAGLAASRIARIAPAIEPLTAPGHAQRVALRAELSLPSGAPMVLYPGDLEFGGGAELMVEVMRALRKETLLVMACRAKTERARAAQAALQERVRALGLAPRVRFEGETARIHDLLACADVVALPSVDLYAKMDYPLVLLEAMSLQRSVIVAEGSAAAELSEEGGAWALPAHVDALAHGIEQLLGDEPARERLGERARQCVCTRYAYPVMARAYEQLYDQLVP